MPDTAVIGRLSAYGKVISFRRDRAPVGVENGIRTPRMSIQQPIPSSVRIAGEPIRIWYPDQPLMCSKCGDTDHLTRACRNPRCFNCEKPGHRAHQCPEPPLCGVCRAGGHHEAICPFVIHIGNIEETGTPVTYSAAVVDEPGWKKKAAPAVAPPPPPPVKEPTERRKRDRQRNTSDGESVERVMIYVLRHS